MARTLPTIAAHTVPGTVNDMTPRQALAWLLKGNERYVEDVTKRHDFMAERIALVSAQHPFAAVLASADSRIAPELVFDTGLSDLFDVRVAGNFVTDDGLGTPLIVVMGHDNCGAVSAAVKAVQHNTTFPGKIQRLADALKPSVNSV